MEKRKHIVWEANKRLYRAVVSLYGKIYRLGRFKCPDEAHDVAVAFLTELREYSY